MCGFWFRLYELLHSGIKAKLKREEIVLLQVLEQMPTQFHCLKLLLDFPAALRRLLTQFLMFA